MKTFWQTLILIFLFSYLSINNIAYSQGKWEFFERKEILPVLNYKNIFVDSNGNKWFGSTNGLVKYNGKEWIHFKKAYGELRNESITDIIEDSDGNIWITTYRDIEMYDGTSWLYFSKELGNLPDDGFGDAYHAIIKDGDDNLWFATDNGFVIFDGYDWTYLKEKDGITFHLNLNMVIDINGNIWAFNNEDIIKYNGEIWEIVLSYQFSTDCYDCLLSTDSNENLWVYDGEGALKIDVNTNEILQEIIIDEYGLDCGANHLTDLVIDNSENILFSTWSGGLSVINNDSSANMIIGDCNDLISINDLEFYKDTLWAAGQDGIYAIFENNLFLYGSVSGFPSNTHRNIFEDEANNIWIKSETVVKYENGKWTEYYFESNTPINATNLINRNGDIWFTSGDKIMILKPNGEWTYYDNFNSLISDGLDITVAEKDRLNNNIYFGGYDGEQMQFIYIDSLNDWHDISSGNENFYKVIADIKYVESQGIFFLFTDGTCVQKNNNDYYSFNTNNTYQSNPYMLEEFNESLLIGADDGIFFYKDSLLNFQNLKDTFNISTDFRIIKIDVDYKNDIWAAGWYQSNISINFFLGRYSNGKWFRYEFQEQYLDSTLIYDLHVTKDRILWITTINEILKFTPFSEIVTLSYDSLSCYLGNDSQIIITPEGSNPPYKYSIDGGNSFQSENIFNALKAGNYHIIVYDGDSALAHDEVITIHQPNPFFEYSVTNVSCHNGYNGMIELSILDSSQTVSFKWEDNSTELIKNNLSAGIYNIETTFGTCINSIEVKVTEPDTITISYEVNHICNNEPTGQLIGIATGGTTSYLYSIDSGSNYQEELVFSIPNSGFYTITIKDSKGCITENDLVIENIIINKPDINILGDSSICSGTSTILESSGQYEYYEWYGVDNGLISRDTNAVVYDEDFYFLITTIKNCTAYSDTVFINIIDTYQDQQICVVTVDPETEKNKIIWSKIPNEFIERYNVFKETGSDVYSSIGTINYDSSNFFIDVESNPLQTSERYKLSITNVCGEESNQSIEHKTIYLQASLGLDDVVNLIWTNYEGFDYTQVNILRGSSYDSLEILATRPANNNTYTDTEPITGQSLYIIEAIASYSCDDGHSGGRIAEENAYTRSNPSRIERTTGIQDDLSNLVKIYPNPSSGFYNLILPEYVIGNELMVVNILGEVIYKTKVTSTDMEIDLSSVPNGQYIVMLEEMGYCGKIIKR